MNDIRALLKVAARRLELISFIDRLHLVAIVFAGLALALMVADRATASAFVPWLWVGLGLVTATLAIAIVLWSQRRATEAHVAVVVDERLDLREKMSTALHCQGRDDAFAQAAIEDAVKVARDARTHEQLRRRFGFTPPRAWWISPLIVLAAIMISFLDPKDLFNRDSASDPAVHQAKAEVQQVVEAITKIIKESPELAKELEGGELSKEGLDPSALKKPEDIKRDALKSVTNLQKKLDDIINGEKGKTAQALEDALKQLKTPEDGAAKELSEALAQGDFSKAQQSLKNMMDKLEKGQLNEADKKKLADQLEKMAEQLDKLAQQQQKLEQALKQAGLDPNLAKNPQALQQAIQNNQNLNQQQKQQLQQQAKAQQQAGQMCKGLGQACQQMAQACNGQQGQQGQQGQMAQAGQQMAGQLGEMEMMQQLMMQAQAAANQCQGQCSGMGQGLNMQDAMNQWAMKNGANLGNRGIGAGGKGQVTPTPFGTKVEKANIKTVEGDIIAKQLFEGPQVRGETKVALRKVVEEARKGYDEAQADDQLHRKYSDAEKHYFGELEKLVKPAPATPPAEKKPDPAPAAAEPEKKTGS